MKKSAILLSLIVTVNAQTDYALSFDGSYDYVDYGNADSLNPRTHDYSVGLWVKTSDPNGTLFEKRLDYEIWYEAFIKDDYVVFEFTKDYPGLSYAGCTSSHLVTDGLWHYVVVVFDRDGYGTIYVDGQFSCQADITTHAGDLVINASLRLGKGRYEPALNGTIDEVTIWKKALVAGEILELFKSGDELNLTSNFGDYSSSLDLVGYWRFNEGTGTTVSDASGNSNTGTIFGNANWIKPIPNPFDLVSPEKNIAIQITAENNWTDTLYFAWNKAVKASTYNFAFIGDLGVLYWHLFDHCDETKLMCKIPYHRIEDLLSIEGVEIVDGSWDIIAYNGELTTNSSNGPFTLSIDASSVNVEEVDLIPETFSLHANYPNPFNPTTTITYDLPKRSQVTLGIYDLLGKQIKKLVNQSQDAGNKIAMWDGTDNLGRQVSAGVYIYRLQSQDFQKTRKMLLLK